MKSSLIVRPVDSNGRVVIPKNLLTDVLNAKDNEKLSVEIFYDEDSIILKRFHPTCVFCDNRDELVDFHGAKICPDCLKSIKKL